MIYNGVQRYWSGSQTSLTFIILYGRQAARQTDMQMGRQRDRQNDREADRHTGRRTDRQPLL